MSQASISVKNAERSMSGHFGRVRNVLKRATVVNRLEPDHAGNMRKLMKAMNVILMKPSNTPKIGLAAQNIVVSDIVSLVHQSFVFTNLT